MRVPSFIVFSFESIARAIVFAALTVRTMARRRIAMMMMGIARRCPDGAGASC